MDQIQLSNACDILSYLVYFFYSLALYIEPNIYVVYAIQLMGGIAAGIGWTAYVEIFVKAIPTEQYTAYYSLSHLASYSVGSLASAGSGFAATYFGIQAVFLIMAGFSLFSMSLAILFWYLIGRCK